MAMPRVVIEDGVARFVYDDALASLAKEGTVTRASHVEPHPTGKGWLADMRPSGGPVLGLGCEWNPRAAGIGMVVDGKRYDLLKMTPLVPFGTRQAALDAEREWLRKEKGL